MKTIPMEHIKLVSKDANEVWLRRKAFFLNILNNKTGSTYLRQAFNHVRNKVNRTLSELRIMYYMQKLDENKDDIKGIWKVLKQAMGQGTKSNNINKILYNDCEFIEQSKIADICNEHFVSIGERLAEGIPKSDESPTAHIEAANSSFVFQKITTSQTEKVLKKLINGKATGVHNIPNKILKDSYQIIAPFLSDIFYCSISMNTFPNNLKIGRVSPAHKSGDRDDLNNYRPISVLPTIARVFERLLYNQICTYLTESKLLGQHQFGFRSIHSTALPLGRSTNQWLMNINNGNLNSVVFLDIKKAFDTVDHKILLQKLACYGINGSSLKLIESYLKDRSQCCSVNGQLSSMKIIVCGVPQGSIIGPLLFIIYMNDLPQYLSDIDITMFADDTSFARAFKSLGEIRTELIPAFSKICRWLSFNKLSLNTVKTEFMIIGTPKYIKKLDVDPGSTPYMIVAADGSRIRRVKLVKSLGLIVDDTLTWSNHIEYISTKMKQGIGVIKKTSKYLDKHSLLMLYRSLVETHLRYCNTRALWITNVLSLCLERFLVGLLGMNILT